MRETIWKKDYKNNLKVCIDKLVLFFFLLKFELLAQKYQAVSCFTFSKAAIVRKLWCWETTSDEKIRTFLKFTTQLKFVNLPLVQPSYAHLQGNGKF